MPSTQHLAGIGRLVGNLRRGPSNVVTKTPLSKLLTPDLMAEFERVIGSAAASPKQAVAPLGQHNQVHRQKLQLKKAIASPDSAWRHAGGPGSGRKQSPASSGTQTMLKSMEMRQSRARLINDRSALFARPSLDLKIVNSPLAQSGHQQTFRQFPANTQPGTKSSWNSKKEIKSPQSQRFISQTYTTNVASSAAAFVPRTADEETKEAAEGYRRIIESPGRAQLRDSTNQTDLPEPVDSRNRASANNSGLNLGVDQSIQSLTIGFLHKLPEDSHQGKDMNRTSINTHLRSSQKQVDSGLGGSLSLGPAPRRPGNRLPGPLHHPARQSNDALSVQSLALEPRGPQVRKQHELDALPGTVGKVPARAPSYLMQPQHPGHRYGEYTVRPTKQRLVEKARREYLTSDIKQLMISRRK